MLTPEQIVELERFDAGGERVLSVYLDLDPRRQVRRAYRIVLEDLAKEVRSRLGRKEAGAVRGRARPGAAQSYDP
jgi:hypothetical protein